MRIISGVFRGRRFNPPITRLYTRPTMDMAKEGLFNILTNNIDFENSSVLDLFGGTGSISFEFLSRGCKDVTIVENNPSLLKFINNVSVTLKTKENIQIINEDALRFLRRANKAFDIIFMDPPYNYKFYRELIDVIYMKNILNPGGILIVEHDKTHDFSDHPYFRDVRIYGTNRFSFIHNASEVQ